jgi:hypothetical protein
MIVAYCVQCADWDIIVTVMGGPPQLKKMKNGKEPYLHLSFTGSDFYCCLGEEDKVVFPDSVWGLRH